MTIEAAKKAIQIIDKVIKNNLDFVEVIRISCPAAEWIARDVTWGREVQIEKLIELDKEIDKVI